MGYHDLPQYLRRDLRRLYGRHEILFYPKDTPELIRSVERILETKEAAFVELWRESTGFPARQTLKIVEHAVNVEGHYQRRGDLLIFTARPA